MGNCNAICSFSHLTGSVFCFTWAIWPEYGILANLWRAYSFSPPLGGSMEYWDAPLAERSIRGRRHTTLYRCWEYLSCFAADLGCVEKPFIKRLSMAPDYGDYFGIVGAGRWHSSPVGSKSHSIPTQRPPIGTISAYGGGTGGVCASPPA